jgi:hypothetical protein
MESTTFLDGIESATDSSMLFTTTTFLVDGIESAADSSMLSTTTFLHFSPVRSMPPMAMQMRSCSVRWSDD